MGAIRAMAGIVQGFEKSQDRYTKIQAARYKKQQEDELFDLKKKKFNLEIEEKQKRGEIDDVFASIMQGQFKEQEDLHKAKSTLDDNALDTASKKELDAQETMKRTGSKIMSALQRQQQSDDLPFDYSFNRGTGFTYKSKKPVERKVTAVDKALGEIAAGEQSTAMGVRKIKSREEAERHATRKLGADWKTKFPEAVESIDQQFGKGYSVGDVKDVQGKGKWKYLGEDKWKRVR